jgi:hypothetical protein
VLPVSSLYGRTPYGAGLYGGGYPPFKPNVPTQIWVWDKLLEFKAMYQLGCSPLVSISFSHGAKGCGSCSLSFAQEVDIAKDDRIKISLFNSDQYFYTGVIRNTPVHGSTKKGFEYQGFGYNDYFKRLNGGALSYAGDTIETIVLDLLNTKVLPNSPINYSLDKFQPPVITITSLESNYTQIDEVFDALLKIANSTGIEYNYGVDKDGDFFWLPRSEDTKVILTVGKRGRYSIQSYEPEDSNEARTKIILLDKDGVYISTLNSTEDNEVWEEKVTAPDISNADALLWAAGILAEKERTTRSASIDWKIESYYPDVLVADGYIRIMSTIPPKKQITVTGVNAGDGNAGDGYAGGGLAVQWTTLDDTLAIKEVKYKITGKSANRSIELGALPLRLEDQIVDVDKRLTELKISLGV